MSFLTIDTDVENLATSTVGLLTESKPSVNRSFAYLSTSFSMRMRLRQAIWQSGNSEVSWGEFGCVVKSGIFTSCVKIVRSGSECENSTSVSGPTYIAVTYYVR